MTQSPVMPGAEPFSADGDRGVGIVVSHGFTGTPASMRPWAEHLAAAGFSVRLPLLPGHGTRWQDANRCKWQDWYGTIEHAYHDLVERHEKVFAFGLSMGGTLVTRLAENVRDGLSGLVLVNPSYGTERLDAKFARYVSWLVRSQSSIGNDIKKPGAREPSYDHTPVPAFVQLQKMWKVVVADLARITAPVLMYRSTVDHVVEPLSGRILQVGATGTTVREVLLHDSYHVATLDNDAQQIFTGSVEFVDAILASNSAPTGPEAAAPEAAS